MLSFVLVGIGLELFGIGYSMPQTAVAFLMVDFMCSENVRFLLRVTPGYLDVGDQSIWWLFIVR